MLLLWTLHHVKWAQNNTITHCPQTYPFSSVYYILILTPLHFGWSSPSFEHRVSAYSFHLSPFFLTLTNFFSLSFSLSYPTPFRKKGSCRSLQVYSNVKEKCGACHLTTRIEWIVLFFQILWLIYFIERISGLVSSHFSF